MCMHGVCMSTCIKIEFKKKKSKMDQYLDTTVNSLHNQVKKQSIRSTIQKSHEKPLKSQLHVRVTVTISHILDLFNFTFHRHSAWQPASISTADSHFRVALRLQKPSGLLGTGSPGRPPRLSHSSWALSVSGSMWLYIHKNHQAY